jgi:hypothetical protein
MALHQHNALSDADLGAGLPPIARRPVDLGAPAPPPPPGVRALAGEVVMAPLLDLDPTLGDGLAPAVREQVRQWLVVRVCELPRGRWPGGLDDHPELMGLLVLEGVLARSAGLGRTAYPELLGPGALLRPWQPDVGGRIVQVEVDWHVIEPCRIALLDRRLIAIAGRWPELVDALLSRALDRARALDVNMAIAQLPLLEVRLLALLWHLADRWGRPVPGGMLVPVRLTHSVLGALVLGRRPSVSTALGDLAARGVVSRRDDGWLLHGDPPAGLHGGSLRDGGAPSAR